MPNKIRPETIAAVLRELAEQKVDVFRDADVRGPRWGRHGFCADNFAGFATDDELFAMACKIARTVNRHVPIGVLERLVLE